jgi:hypothetical protein
MPFLDRDSFIDLLKRLGSKDDRDVLVAAREIDRRMSESGVDWDRLLVVSRGDGETADGPDDSQPALPQGSAEEDVKLIDSILHRHRLSDDARQEILDMKQDVADGSFTAVDRKYLRDLDARLTRRAKD